MELLTVTGQDCTTGKSVGSFVSNLMDKLLEKSVLASLSWAGTPRKPALKDFQVVVSIIIGDPDMMYKLNVRNWRRIIEKPCCLQVLHSAVSSQDKRPTN